MPIYIVRYQGSELSLRNLSVIVIAQSKGQAVEDFYCEYFNENYFPQEDGSIQDCFGDVIAEAGSHTIKYAGGYFYAEEEKEIG